MGRSLKAVPSASPGLLEDFDAFEVTHQSRHRGRCWVCCLQKDMLRVLHELKKRGKGPKVLALWLKTQGHEKATPPKLSYHFSNDHGQ